MTTTKGHRRDAGAGIRYILLGQLVYSFHDVMLKFISGTYPVHEIILIRSCISLVPILAVARWKEGRGSLKTQRIGAHITRSLVMFASYLSFYLALSALPLAEVISLFFASPIFITILAVLFLKEPVDGFAWIAVFTGFLGVILMIRPGAGMTDPAAFMAVLSAVLYAVSSILARRLGRTETGLSLSFYPMVVYIVCSAALALGLSLLPVEGVSHPSLAFLFGTWQLPAKTDVWLFSGIGLLAAFGLFCLSQAYRLGQPSRIAPFEYVAVPLGVVWGYAFWLDLPGAQSVAGMLMIVGSGLFIIYRKNA